MTQLDCIQGIELLKASSSGQNAVYPSKSAKVADINFLISQLSKVSTGNDSAEKYETILNGNINLIISSQFGSVFLQGLLEKSSKELISYLYKELRTNYYSLLKHTYANYFCQVLFKKLEPENKYEVVMEIINNLGQMLKNMISFKAIVSILETPLKEETQDEILGVLYSLNKPIIVTHARYIKIIEVVASHFNEDRLLKLLDIIEPVFDSLLKIKQGYFLMRKILKNSQTEMLRMRIVDLINKTGITEVLASNNGCLLSQCILKNFDDVNQEGRTSEDNMTHSAYELINIKNANDYSKIELGSTSTSGKSIAENETFNLGVFGQPIKHESNTIEEAMKALKVNPEKTVTENSETALIRFFDMFTVGVVFNYSKLKYSKPIYKSQKKVYGYFLSLAGYNLKERLLQLIFENKGLNGSETIKSMLIFFQCTTIFEDLIQSSEKSNSIRLVRLLIEIQISGVSKDLDSKYFNLRSNLIKNSSLDLMAFDSKLFMGFDAEDSFGEQAGESCNNEKFQSFIDCNQSFFEIKKKNDLAKKDNLNIQKMDHLINKKVTHSVANAGTIKCNGYEANQYPKSNLINMNINSQTASQTLKPNQFSHSLPSNFQHYMHLGIRNNEFSNIYFHNGLQYPTAYPQRLVQVYPTYYMPSKNQTLVYNYKMPFN